MDTNKLHVSTCRGRHMTINHLFPLLCQPPPSRPTPLPHHSPKNAGILFSTTNVRFAGWTKPEEDWVDWQIQERISNNRWDIFSKRYHKKMGHVLLQCELPMPWFAAVAGTTIQASQGLSSWCSLLNCYPGLVPHLPVPTYAIACSYIWQKHPFFVL